jgi:hypothetical protein
MGAQARFRSWPTRGCPKPNILEKLLYEHSIKEYLCTADCVSEGFLSHCSSTRSQRSFNISSTKLWKLLLRCWEQTKPSSLLPAGSDYKTWNRRGVLVRRTTTRLVGYGTSSDLVQADNVGNIVFRRMTAPRIHHEAIYNIDKTSADRRLKKNADGHQMDK